MTAQSLAVAQSSPTQRLFGVSPTKEGPHHALVERTDRPSTAAGLVRKLAEMAVFGHFAAGLPKNQKKTLSAVSAPLELLPSRQKTSLGPPNCSRSNRGAVNSCRTRKLAKRAVLGHFRRAAQNPKNLSLVVHLPAVAGRLL